MGAHIACMDGALLFVSGARGAPGPCEAVCDSQLSGPRNCGSCSGVEVVFYAELKLSMFSCRVCALLMLACRIRSLSPCACGRLMLTLNFRVAVVFMNTNKAYSLQFRIATTALQMR